jgi:ubiquinone/menaquinone biosynthesis C-methylase UbiE
MQEKQIEEFWNAHSCGEFQVGGFDGDYEGFFRRYDAFRYQNEAHILRCLDAIDFTGKRVLEIGLGQGADSEQIIRRGGIWSGLDLTQESVDRVRKRLILRNLPYSDLKQGSVLEIPYPDQAFDVAYSHGVLHHVPDILQAQAEIARVLRPDGLLVVMLYAKYSLNYLVSTALVRRLGLIALRLAPGMAKGIYRQHLDNAARLGLWRYLRMSNFIHCNTDGPLNPYSKVYTLAEVRKDFPAFRIVKAHKEFMHAPPLPVHGLPGARALGWHLWVYMMPRAGSTLSGG